MDLRSQRSSDGRQHWESQPDRARSPSAKTPWVLFLCLKGCHSNPNPNIGDGIIFNRFLYGPYVRAYQIIHEDAVEPAALIMRFPIVLGLAEGLGFLASR